MNKLSINVGTFLSASLLLYIFEIFNTVSIMYFLIVVTLYGQIVELNFFRKCSTHILRIN